MLPSILASEGGSAVLSSPLTAAIVIPFVGAIVVAAIPRSRAELHRVLAFAFAAASGAVALWLMLAFDANDGGFQFESTTPWISDFGISWHVGIDGISLFLVVLSGLLFPLSIIAVKPHHDPKPYYAWLLLLQAGSMGVFCALDLFMFFVMFEIVLVPMYFLIGGWGYADRVYAALKFFLFTMLGSAFMIVGIVALAFLHRDGVRDDNREEVSRLQARTTQQISELSTEAQGLDPNDPGSQAAFDDITARIDELNTHTRARVEALSNPKLDFNLVTIAEDQKVPDTSTSANPLDWGAARWLFLAFAVAFAVKVPLFPVHTWLPDAHTQAPTAGSVILAAILLKFGTYGFVRFGLYLFPDATVFFAPAMVTLGVIGIIYGAIVAAMQKDLKRVIAYSSVAHLGFIALGTFALTRQGIQGGVLQMINHGLSTGALFLLVGMIYDRRHTRMFSALRGMQKSAPILAGAFTLVMMSSIGVPGLNGFAGEFLILVGSFLTRRWWTVVAAAGVILAAVYLLWAYQRVFHGEPDDDNRNISDLGWQEMFVLAPLIGLIVFLGVYPKPVLERIEPAVDHLIAHIEDHSDYVEPAVARVGDSVAAGEGAADERGK